MAKIFISYRREDSAYPAHQIYRELSDYFGSESVVLDVDTIPFGADFREYLNKQVSESDVLLAVIGDRWIETLKQRLNEPKDFVRIEIQAALEREIPVVPVLVDNASVPLEKNLPPELVKLAYKQTAEVRAGSDLETHLKRLISGLDRLIAERKQRDAERERRRKAEVNRKLREAEEAKRRAEEERKRKEAERARKAERKRIEALETERNISDLKTLLTGREEPSSEKKFELFAGEETPKIYTNSIGMEFVLIPAGKFKMGTKLSREYVAQKYGPGAGWAEHGYPQHEVTMSQPFYLQTTQVTQGQWQEVMEDNPSKSIDCGENFPVESVSWNDVQEFIRRLNWQECHDKHRLPTEAEWEYACRAGTTTEYSFGDDVSKLNEYAWYSDNSEMKTHPVRQKKPNAWGLYDMHGNVLEWVEDDWHENYDGAPDDGRAWVDKPRDADRVLRGGSWYFGARSCRSAYRNYRWPDLGRSLVGFRLSRSVALGP